MQAYFGLDWVGLGVGVDFEKAVTGTYTTSLYTISLSLCCTYLPVLSDF